MTDTPEPARDDATQACPACGGIGQRTADPESECSRCFGTGEAARPAPARDDATPDGAMSYCPRCGGGHTCYDRRGREPAPAGEAPRRVLCPGCRLLMTQAGEPLCTLCSPVSERLTAPELADGAAKAEPMDGPFPRSAEGFARSFGVPESVVNAPVQTADEHRPASPAPLSRKVVLGGGDGLMSKGPAAQAYEDHNRSEGGPAPLTDEEPDGYYWVNFPPGAVDQPVRFYEKDGVRWMFGATWGSPHKVSEFAGEFHAVWKIEPDTVAALKARAEEAERERDDAAGEAKARTHEAERMAETIGMEALGLELQLADIRARLGGHPDSQLDGENGLAAATMRDRERLKARLDDVSFCEVHDFESLTNDTGSILPDVRPAIACVVCTLTQLREENERLRSIPFERGPDGEPGGPDMGAYLQLAEEKRALERLQIHERDEAYDRGRAHVSGLIFSVLDPMPACAKGADVVDDVQALHIEHRKLREEKRALEERVRELEGCLKGILRDVAESPEASRNTREAARAALKGGE